jgi:hypothetical protein
MIGAQGESWASLCMGREQLESPQHARRIEQAASEHRDYALLQLPCIARLTEHLLHHRADRSRFCGLVVRKTNAWEWEVVQRVADRPRRRGAMLFAYCAATSTRASL